MKQVQDTDKRLVFIPLEKATVPPSGIIEHFKDCWWTIHPAKGVAFWLGSAAQCNSNEAVARSIAERMYPWAEVRQIPSVFHRINPRDYY